MKQILRVLLFAISFFYTGNLWLCHDAQAAEHLITPAREEYDEILRLREEILLSSGYRLAEPQENGAANPGETEPAYRVYGADSDLLRADDLRAALEASQYQWQFSFYAGNRTVFMNIIKKDPAGDALSEAAGEPLSEASDQWERGGFSVYEGQRPFYRETVDRALEAEGLDSEDYFYEIVSGIPKIRYPAAIVFDSQRTPVYVIPAEAATLHAFSGSWPVFGEAEPVRFSYEAAPEKYADVMPVFYYEDVARAANAFWLGSGGIGIEAVNLTDLLWPLLALGSLLVLGSIILKARILQR